MMAVLHYLRRRMSLSFPDCVPLSQVLLEEYHDMRSFARAVRTSKSGLSSHEPFVLGSHLSDIWTLLFALMFSSLETASQFLVHAS